MVVTLLRRASRLLPVALFLISSCNEPLVIAPGPELSWKIDWYAYIDVKCISQSDREVASRTRLNGTSTIRVVRPHDDSRSEVPIDAASSAVTPQAFLIYSNCDPTLHTDAALVSVTSSRDPFTISGSVHEYPGIDSIRLNIRGRFTPAVVRFTMKDGSGTVVERPVTSDSLGFTITVPYTVRSMTVNRYESSPDGSVAYAYTLAMTPKLAR